MSLSKPTAAIAKALQTYETNDSSFRFYGWELYFYMDDRMRERFRDLVIGYENAEAELS